MEGSFGNEKNHYLLQKSRARAEATDIAWIFFGMMSANVPSLPPAGKKQMHRLRQELHSNKSSVY
ncbi:MAG: hypothetical protein ABI723_09770 [Bacteroidia bacterium]